MNYHVTDSMDDSFEGLKKLVDNLSRWRAPIESALSRAGNTHAFDDIVTMVMANKLFFFCTEKAFAIVEIEEYPQYNNLHCFLAGGKLEELLGKVEAMKEFGDQLGCRNFTMAGRRGWARVLKQRGWEHSSTTMSTPIVGDR